MGRDFNFGKYAVIAIAMLFLTICSVWFLSTINSGGEYADRIILDSGWKITINGQEHQNVTLSEFSFELAQRGDHLVLEHVLPESAEYATIRLWMCHSSIDAYLDDELFYTYGHEQVANNTMVGSGYYFIALPVDYADKTLRIEFGVGEMDAISTFDPIYLENSNTVFRSFLNEKFMVLIIGIFLMIFGLVGIILTSFMLSNWRVFKKLIYIFWFSVLIGCWTMCNNGITQLFCKNYIIPQGMEFVSLFLAAIPIMLFMVDIVKDNKLLNKLNNILIIANVAFNVIVYVCVLLGIAHFQLFLAPYHILILFVVIDVSGGIYLCLKSGKSMERYVVFGCIFMVVGLLVDIISFNIRKYTDLDLFYIDYGTVVGSLIMVCCLFVSYFVYIREQIITSAETEMLEKLAYHDILTGAINRVKFEEILDQADGSKDGYAVMYFDLNGLKQVNDTLGHAQGDNLIKEFTICLEVVFKDRGEVARLGGDEFAILLPKAGKEDIIGYVKDLQAYIKNHNQESQLKLDTAFGVAFRHEAMDDNSRTVCKLADSRMYHMKRQMKNARI